MGLGFAQSPGLSQYQPSLAIHAFRIGAQLPSPPQQGLHSVQIAQAAVRSSQEQMDFCLIRRQAKRRPQPIEGFLVFAAVQQLSRTTAVGSHGQRYGPEKRRSQHGDDGSSPQKSFHEIHFAPFDQ
jgi:hypothetical protein